MPVNPIVTIPGNDFSYPIVYDNATGETVRTIMEQVGIKNRRIAMITDRTVYDLQKTRALISDLGLTPGDSVFCFEPGERNKNRDIFNDLQDRLLRHEFRRDSAVIALGGGVVGDMAGLVADQHMRGVPLVQIPTTVLAQADSSIGGKVGIDAGKQKNAIGAFKHPNAVIIDTSWLKTLSDEQYRNGMAETVKHGVLADPRFFGWLSEYRGEIATRTADDDHIAWQNCHIKREVVQADPEEKGRRKTLNYGHTAGHAIEAASEFELPHGYCVAIGMNVAGRIATLLKTGFTEGDLQTQNGLLTDLGLPIHIPRDLSLDEILQIMRGDKKNEGGKTNFTLPKSIGSMADFDRKWAAPVDEGMIREVLEASRN